MSPAATVMSAAMRKETGRSRNARPCGVSPVACSAASRPKDAGTPNTDPRTAPTRTVTTSSPLVSRSRSIRVIPTRLRRASSGILGSRAKEATEASSTTAVRAPMPTTSPLKLVMRSTVWFHLTAS